MSEPTTQPEDDGKRESEVDAEAERIEEIVKRHVAVLSEHCDSVRIIITTNRGDGNYGQFSWGSGNFFAQRDSVREWLMRQDQSTKNDSD